MTFVMVTPGNVKEQFENAAGAHAALGFYAGVHMLEVHAHPGSWSGTAISTAYRAGGDALFDAVAVVRLIRDDDVVQTVNLASRTASLRSNRVVTTYGGLGMNIQLPHMRTTEQVFWSANGNSYVTDGVRVISVNGLGEIRWSVEEWNRDSDSNSARAYFFHSVKE